MLLARECRAKARMSLKGRWGLAVGAWVGATLLGGTYHAMTYMNLISSSQTETTNFDGTNLISDMIVLFILAYFIALCIIGTATRIGYAKFNINLTQQKPVEFFDIFWGYSVFGKSLLLSFICFLIYFVVAFVLSFVSIATILLFFSDYMSFEAIILFVVIVAIIVTIPLTILMLRIYFAPNIIADNPNIKAFEALKLSNKLMKGNVWRLFCLNLSFIGWNILAGLTLYIGLLWVGPYFEAATAVFYRDVVNDNILKNQSQLNYMVNPQREISF